MSPEAQRIAIAKTCGWTYEAEFNLWFHPTLDHEHGDGGAPTYLPDYLNDLNAMHEAEKVIVNGDSEQRSRWFIWMQVHGDVAGIHATAAQRAEAVLRTLNLWTE